MLLRHAWLAQLMKPPTIEEDEEAELAAESGGDAAADMEPLPLTADKEVAAWVHDALDKKRQGKLTQAEKPALHAVELDKVPNSPMNESSSPDRPITPNPGIRVESPELVHAKISSLDFATGVEIKSTEEE